VGATPSSRSDPEEKYVIPSTRRIALAAALASVLPLVACQKADRPTVVKLDYATYNPVGLLLKEKGLLDQDLAKDGIKVEWVKSLGSNKSLELLNSKSVDFGSTAGAAALIARSNGNPIRSVYVYSKPEWTALVTTPGSGVNRIEDLKGKKVAVTRGTDPFVFLVRSLASVGLSDKDVEIVPLQHPDGKTALERGDVAAWSGLDPLMATTEVERGSKLFFRSPDWNTYGVLNVREEFAQKHPEIVDRVLAAYEKARKYAIAHPDELKAALAKEAHLSDPVAVVVIGRTDISSGVIGEKQAASILAAGEVLKKGGVVKPDVDVGAVVKALIDPTFSARLAN
jgi:sulfonate transport system substrate-binding protein